MVGLIPEAPRSTDLLVVGCGGAGLSTAVAYLEARLDGSVTVLEVASEDERGGATRWTNALLRVHEDDRMDRDWGSHSDASRALTPQHETDWAPVIGGNPQSEPCFLRLPGRAGVVRMRT